jgi:hypothetical protein
MTQTLAHYNKWRAWTLVAFLLLLILVVAVLTYILFKKIANGWHQASAVIYCIIAWVAIIQIARTLFVMVRQLVFHDARLIWIENGELICHDAKTFSVRCSEIDKVVDGFGGDFGQFDTLVFKMRDGSDRVIMPGASREKLSDVVKRLSEIIHSQEPSRCAAGAG